jgi:hypothetical protein
MVRLHIDISYCQLKQCPAKSKDSW